MTVTEKLHRLKQIYQELTKLDQISCLLSWDQETYMPPLAAEGRAEQLAVLANIIHEKATSVELSNLLYEVYQQRDQLDFKDRKFVEIKYRSSQIQNRLTPDFVTAWSALTSQAMEAWKTAKQKQDFALFAPFLEKIVALVKEKTRLLEQPNNYDVLLDYYEPGLTKDLVEVLFAQLKTGTKELLASLPDNQPIISLQVPTDWQKRFSQKLLSIIGYNFQSGREDEVAHPFMTRVGNQDIRVTNTFYENNFSSFFSALHEGGHALYEQGMDLDYVTLLGDNERSLVLHESQSRFWENIIGRSESFWAPLWPQMQAELSTVFGSMELADYLSMVNLVKPSLIRVQADEVTYNLHIIIRYEIEKLLVEDNLPVIQVPVVWAEKYEQYLGVRPENDAEGCLQDIHWSMGNFGYFPTYTLGNILAAQIWAQFQKENPNFSEILAKQDYSQVLGWLQRKVHQPGTLLGGLELVQQLTGEKLNVSYLLNYLASKYMSKKFC